MYALVEIKGKQYRAEKGSLLRVDRIEGAEGDIVEFEQVLLVAGGEPVKVGFPYVNGVKVRTKVERHGRSRKVVVFKYKRRKGYKKSQGHREHYTVVRVEEIIGA